MGQPAASPSRSPVVRWLCAGVGGSCVALGVVGVFLPVLPTTPFLLAAVACFARASHRLHRAMHEHRWAGPLIRDWERHHSLPRKVRQGAILMMTLSFTLSISLLEPMPAKLGLFAMWLALLFWLMRIPVRERL